MTTLYPPQKYCDGSDSGSEGSEYDDVGLKRELEEDERQRIEVELKRQAEELTNTPYKVLLVGDSGIGKLVLLNELRARAITAGIEQPAKRIDDQSPGVKYVFQTQMEHVRYENLSNPTLFFHDAGDLDPSNCNPSSNPYRDADAVLLCFNVTSRQSFDNIAGKWIEVLKKACPDIPTTLIGLQDDETVFSEIKNPGTIEVKPSQARKLSRKLVCQSYLDLSGSEKPQELIPKLLQQCASDARYGRLIRRRDLTGTHAREGEAWPERIMLYTIGAFAAPPMLLVAGIASAQNTGFGLKPLIRKVRERSNRGKMAKTESSA